jgi:hypothetical protein
MISLVCQMMMLEVSSVVDHSLARIRVMVQYIGEVKRAVY